MTSLLLGFKPMVLIIALLPPTKLLNVLLSVISPLRLFKLSCSIGILSGLRVIDVTRCPLARANLVVSRPIPDVPPKIKIFSCLCSAANSGEALPAYTIGCPLTVPLPPICSAKKPTTAIKIAMPNNKRLIMVIISC